MNTTISKSEFKPHVLEYLRLVEKKKQPLIITHEGKPVVKILPYTYDWKKKLEALQGSVLKYENPSEPVGLEDWERLK